jgi:hypothetical protein
MTQTPQNSFQNFLQSNTGLLLDFCASKMLYGHLGKRAKTSRKQHSAFTSKSMHEYQSYRPYRICTVQTVLSTSVFVPFPVVQNSKIHTVRPLCSDCTLPRFLCLHFLLYNLLNLYSIAYLQCCPCCLDLCASLQPWNVFPSSAKMASSPNSKMLSLSLALSTNESTTQQWVRPPTLIDLMR